MLKRTTIRATLDITMNEEKVVNALKALSDVVVAGGNEVYCPLAEFQLSRTGELVLVLQRESDWKDDSAN